MSDETTTFKLESYEEPEWLTEVLDACRRSGSFWDAEAQRASPELMLRYEEAAKVAHSLALLGKERQRIGFVPLSFADYVNGLVKVNGVALGPALRWFGIGDLARPEPSSARAFARLAQGLGIGLRETLAHIRISFAALIDAAPIPLLLARHRSSGARGSQMDECEAVLVEVEAEYDLQSLRRLRRTESEIRDAYAGLERTG